MGGPVWDDGKVLFRLTGLAREAGTQEEGGGGEGEDLKQFQTNGINSHITRC